jgi:hypothetical protein
MRPDPCIRFWEGGAYPLADGLTLIHCGGHFAGGTVLHWAEGARGHGAWWERVVTQDGKQAVQRSAQRYIAALQHGL